MAFADSTHSKHWLYPRDQLLALYTARHDGGVRLCLTSSSTTTIAPAPPTEGGSSTLGSKRPRSGDAVESEGGSKRARTEGGGGEGSVALSTLTLEEEQGLLDWCSLALLRLCLTRNLDREITATALVYFRRFYVRGLFPYYPPHEMITSAVFLAIKAVACPYTEVEEFIRQRLAPMDEAWRCEYRLLLAASSGESAAGESHPTPAASPSAAAAAAAMESEGALSPHSSQFSPRDEPQYLINEVPLLSGGGLNFQLTVHLPYRPLKTLLKTALEAQGKESGSGSSSSSSSSSTFPPPTSPFFVASWDAVQQRAMGFLDAAMASDVTLIHSPSVIATGALLCALDTVEGCGGWLRRHSLGGIGGVSGEDAPFLFSDGGVVVVSGGGAAGEVAAWPPVGELGQHVTTLNTWLKGWFKGHLKQGAWEGGISAKEGILAFLQTSSAAEATATPVNSLRTLTGGLDPHFIKGTPAYTARLGELKVSVAKYKEGKAARATTALASHEALVRREDEVWGVVPL